MKLSVLLTFSLCLALIAGDDKFWEKRGVAEWTPEQMAQFTSASPWAKHVTAVLISNDSSMVAGGPATRTGRHSAVISSRGSSNPSPNTDIPKFQGVVRWVSAPAMTKILKPKLPEEFKGHYVISVSGFPIGGDASGLAEQTTLQLKHGEIVHPEGVYQDPADAETVYFSFLPAMVDVSSGKTAEFNMLAPPFEVRAKFNLGEMKVKGEAAF